MNNLWNNILSELEPKINKQSFDTWFQNTQMISENDYSITVKVFDEIAKDHMTSTYSDIISGISEKLTGRKYEFIFVSDNYITAGTEHIPEKNIQLNNSGVNLYPTCTFENFIVGPNNQFAHSVALSVAKNPNIKFNPVFIYGESGLGKTHLLQAIGHYILKDRPYLKVRYITTETFINEFITSIKNSTQEDFKKQYRIVDVLLVDDIQFLSGKEETQNEFFHRFNDLHENQKQIVISSDKPPQQLAKLEERLQTRFQWGILTDIKPPELETREAILRDKAEKANIVITDDACYFIAKRIKSSIRALEGAVNRLEVLYSLNNSPITTEQAKQHLKDLFDVDADKKITINDIIQKVGKKFEVTPEDLKSSSRNGKLVKPRFAAMYLSRKLLTDKTTTEIGDEFGKRDHSTVLNAVNRAEELINSDNDFKEYIDDLIIDIKN